MTEVAGDRRSAGPPGDRGLGRKSALSAGPPVG